MKLRAFDNDKLDLTELEGLADLLNAETEVQRRLALRQAEGGLRVPYENWREKIVKCMATTEAVIDFGEDENIEEGVMDQVVIDVIELRNLIAAHLNDSHVGEIVRNGIQVAIVGPPNAGKSTLLNRLAKREAAIVSDIPGTTRDVVEVKLNLGGYPVVVCDTAGLRESTDLIEMEGIKRAKSRYVVYKRIYRLNINLYYRILSSDIKICLLSLDGGAIVEPIVKDVIDKDTYVILNKEDAVNNSNDIADIVKKIEKETGAKKVWTMSCTTGLGVDKFLIQMIDILKAK